MEKTTVSGEFAVLRIDKLTEGKTKIVWKTNEPTLVILQSKDDITAGDGKRHEQMEGKASIANNTTCNVFRLLQICGVPLAFKEKVDDESFLAENCAMFPYEVVVRREGHGSYIKRNPHLKTGHYFPRLIVEIFLKTSGKRWKNHDLICDDPFMADFGGLNEGILSHDGKIRLFHPAKPMALQEPFAVIPTSEVFTNETTEMVSLWQMADIARYSFLILEKAWQLLDRRLVDFKVEFGQNHDGLLRLADVVDNDSWQVLEEGRFIDKEGFRGGEAVAVSKMKYERVKELTARFGLPSQSLIIWRGSPKDSVMPFKRAMDKISATRPFTKKETSESVLPFGCLVDICGSMHKQPVSSIDGLNRAIQNNPDSVIIAHIGLSNGAGPTLSANTTVPVITVPVGWEKRPEIVWSSLSNASAVPVSVILEPANAVLHAFQILAMRNPALYALLRFEQEKRFTNMILI